MLGNKHSIERATRRAALLTSINPSVFDYHEKRSKDLIPQNDEPGWSLEDLGRREHFQKMNGLHVTQSFFRVNWNEGFTGRGVHPRSSQTLGDDHLEGPMGETLKGVADVEPPTSRRDREIWQAADRGKRLGDPFDLGSRNDIGDEDEEGSLAESIHADEDRDDGSFGEGRNHEEEFSPSKGFGNEEYISPLDKLRGRDDIGSTNQVKQQAELHASGEMQNGLVDIAKQAFKTLDGDQRNPLTGTRQQVEEDLSSKMMDALMDIEMEVDNVHHNVGVIANGPRFSSINSKTMTTFSSKKRRSDSLNSVANDSADETARIDLDIPCFNPKRPRLDVSEDLSDHGSGVDTSPTKLKSRRTTRKERRIKSRKMRSILRGIGERENQVSRVPTDVGDVGSSVQGELKPRGTEKKKSFNDPATDSRGSEYYGPVPETPAVSNPHGQKRKREESSNLTFKPTNDPNRDTFTKDMIELGQMIVNYANRIPPKSVKPSAVGGSENLDRNHTLDSDDESDDAWQPEPKRLRLERTDDQTHGNRNTEASVNSGNFDGEAPMVTNPITTTARPTFEGIHTRLIPNQDGSLYVFDDKEAEDVIVTRLRKVEPREYEYPPGLPSRVEPGARPWGEEDDETLRSWVQDFGIESWEQIAWCLHRSEKDCRERYPKIVRALNERAGRDLNAGLPGWNDEELMLTAEEIVEKAVEKAEKKAAGELRRRKAARVAEAARQAEEAEVETESGTEEEPKPSEDPNEDQEPGRQAGVEEEEETEPGFISGKKVKVEEEDSAAENSRQEQGKAAPQAESLAPATSLGARPGSRAPRAAPAIAVAQPELSRLRPRKPRANARFGTCGQILYNPSAKSFPRRTEMGALLDPKGDLLPNNEQETALSGGQLPPPKVVGNRKPRGENTGGAIVKQARIPKPQGNNGARRFGVYRRVGRGKRRCEWCCDYHNIHGKA